MLERIDDQADTREILALAKKQAIERKYEDYVIVDADCHNMETASWAEILEYVEDPVIRQQALDSRPRSRPLITALSTPSRTIRTWADASGTSAIRDGMKPAKPRTFIATSSSSGAHWSASGLTIRCSFPRGCCPWGCTRRPRWRS